MNIPEKCSTGIDGLDELLDGGFLRGNVVLVAGNPGAGKTTFAAHFLYKGALEGENGLLVSYAENKEEFYRHMENIGMNFRELEEKGLFTFIEGLTPRESVGIKALTEILIGVMKRRNIKRIVIDSITALFETMEPNEGRAFLHNLINKFTKPMNITLYIIQELKIGEEVIGRGFEEFLADSVIKLTIEEFSGLLVRYLYLHKVREIPIERYKYEVVIDKKGMKLFVPYREGIVGSFGMERLSTGITDLDNMLGGGILKGSTVVISGESGSGKTMLTLSIALKNAELNNNVFFISLEESPEQLRNVINSMDYDEEKYNKNLHLLGLTPRLLTPGRLFYLITETIKENWREDRDCIVILDGGSAIERHFTPEDYMELMRSLIQYFKANNVTFIVTSLHNLFHEKVMISTLSDILIATWFDTRGDEIVRMLAILKERGSPHDRRKRKMFLSNGKVIIK